tara:strand:+ start:182 stop:1513 length:1332 start_codon:yes stop_codon:yes gene_type:complete
MKINLSELTREWSYRVHTGIPDPKDSGHVNTLREILEERKYPRRFIEKLLSRLAEEDLVKNKETGNVYPVKAADDKKHDIVKKNASQTDIDANKQADKSNEYEMDRASVESEEDIQIKDWLSSVPDSIKQDEDLVKQLTRTIQNRSIEKTWDSNMADNANVTGTTFGKRNAPQEIFNILSGNDDLQNYDSYDKPSYEAIGKKGNLINIFSESSMSYESLRELLSMFGSESGRGVGKGETFLSMMLKDVQMADAGAGDLNWNGKYLEVKGSGARVGKRERVFPREFEKTSLGQLAAQSSERGYKTNSKNLKDIIIAINSDSSSNPKRLLDAIIDFEKIAHPHGDASKYFNIDMLGDPAKVRKAFTKNLMANYAAEHGLDKLIFINTKEIVRRSKGGVEYDDRNLAFGNFVTGSPGDDIDRFVEEGILVTGNVTLENLDPAIAKP